VTWKDVDKATGGNPEANTCLAKWAACLRVVDDIVDNQTYSPERILTALALNCEFCADPFYRRHVQRLQFPALIATSVWETSVRWEREIDCWKNDWADVLRHADVIFLSAICLLCQGWQATDKFATEFLEAAHVDHDKRHEKT
jgi:hypothetical protein